MVDDPVVIVAAWWNFEPIWVAVAGLGGGLFSYLTLRRKIAAALALGKEQARLREQAAIAENRALAFAELHKVVSALQGQMVEMQRNLASEQERGREMREELDEQHNLRLAAETNVRRLRNELHAIRNYLQKMGIVLPAFPALPTAVTLTSIETIPIPHAPGEE